LHRYSERLQDVLKLALKEGLFSGSFFATVGVMGNLAICAMLYAGGLMVMSKSISVGELSSFMLYTVYVQLPPLRLDVLMCTKSLLDMWEDP